MPIFPSLYQRLGFLVVSLLFLTSLPVVAAITYPTPDQVAADYSDPAERMAAFYVLTKAINNHGLSQDVANQFMAAQSKLDPPWASGHQEFVKKWYPLAQDPAFTDSVVRKYLPALAGTVHGELVQRVETQQKDRLTEKIHVAGRCLYYTMLAVPLLFLIWPWRVKGHKPKISDDTAGFLRFPEDLRRAHVFRKSYPLAFECGQIFDVHEWTETTSSTTTTPGRVYDVGNVTYREAGTTTTTYSTTKYHAYWINRPDGKQSWTRFADNVFHARRGHHISIVDAGGYILCAYNHTTGGYLRQKWCWTTANSYPGTWVWVATILAIGAMTYALQGYLADDYHHEMPGNWWTSVGMAMIVSAIFAAIYVWIVKVIVQFIRNLQFQWKYEKRIRTFFEQSTPVLQNMFPGMPPEQKMGQPM